MKTEWNPKLIGIARTLRRNMTKEEKHLWYDFLCDYPVRFRRQEIIGNYVADFYCDKQSWSSNWMVRSIMWRKAYGTMQ